MRKLTILPLVILLSTAPASAMCFDPSFLEDAPEPPTMYFVSKPSVPFCLSSYRYTHEHSCSQWELDAYFDDVAKYAEQMRNYYDEVVNFANEATEFANAAVRFSDDAYSYATCEIKEVNTQHE